MLYRLESLYESYLIIYCNFRIYQPNEARLMQAKFRNKNSQNFQCRCPPPKIWVEYKYICVDPIFCMFLNGFNMYYTIAPFMFGRMISVRFHQQRSPIEVNRSIIFLHFWIDISICIKKTNDNMYSYKTNNKENLCINGKPQMCLDCRKVSGSTYSKNVRLIGIKNL